VAILRDHLSLLSRDLELRARLRRGVLSHLPDLTWEAAARRLLEIYTEASGHGPTSLEPHAVNPTSSAAKERRGPRVPV
jgi:hypothetical protein